MGFPKPLLERAYLEGDFAVKAGSTNPSSTSKIVYDTNKFNKWLDRQMKLEKAARALGET